MICKFEGCIKRASFNIKGENKKFCGTHKLPDMIFYSV